jgi:hypothetical protein
LKTQKTLSWMCNFSFRAIEGTDTLKFESIGYDVKKHQEIHRDVVDTMIYIYIYIYIYVFYNFLNQGSLGSMVGRMLR